MGVGLVVGGGEEWWEAEFSRGTRRSRAVRQVRSMDRRRSGGRGGAGAGGKARGN